MTVKAGQDKPQQLDTVEVQKLQQAWAYLLRLCGVENGGLAGAPDTSNALHQLVGDMPPEKFRQGLWDFILSEIPDTLVVRFLRARKWDVEQSMVMLVSAIKWRVERNITEIIRDGESVCSKKDASADDMAFMTQYRSGKSYVRGVDKENRLIYIIKVQLHDPRAQSGEAMERYILHNIESLRNEKIANDKFCLIFDMTGFALKNMDFHVVKFLISVFEARYPETLGVILIHNAPLVFWGVWNMIKSWLDPVIASKINFTRKPTDLLKFISAENLQTSFGGKDSWKYCYIEPSKDENAGLKKTAEITQIQQEREILIVEFGRETAAWTRALPDSPIGNEIKSRRLDAERRLNDNYWELDPYIRAETHYHRSRIT
ncbi:CRAL-TRIO domain-containing protein [Astrocystis sublimbata]|nr:CRAL-TRIO domain-containing protein [Astrocystis sublimbata]